MQALWRRVRRKQWLFPTKVLEKQKHIANIFFCDEINIYYDFEWWFAVSINNFIHDLDKIENCKINKL